MTPSIPCLGLGETQVDVAEPPARGGTAGTAGTAPLQHPLCPLELPRDPCPLPSPSCRQRLAHKGLRKAPGSDTAATSPRAQLLPGRIQPPLGLSHRWVSPGGRGWDRGSPLPGSPGRDGGWGPSWGPALSTRTEQEERPWGSLRAGGGGLEQGTVQSPRWGAAALTLWAWGHGAGTLPPGSAHWGWRSCLLFLCLHPTRLHPAGAALPSTCMGGDNRISPPGRRWGWVWGGAGGLPAGHGPFLHSQGWMRDE